MPQIMRKDIPGSSCYAVWQIRESIEELKDGLNLRDPEQKLLDSFLVESRKKQWLAYRKLIRTLIQPENFPVEYDASGKPFLAGSRYHISVTHSGELAAVILSFDGLAGIDIERIKPRICGIADRFLHPEELGVHDFREDYQLLTFAWCAKEALYKLYGQRGLDFRENIRLKMPATVAGSIIEGEIRQGGHSRYYTLHSELIGEYTLVYVIDPSNR